MTSLQSLIQASKVGTTTQQTPQTVNKAKPFSTYSFTETDDTTSIFETKPKPSFFVEGVPKFVAALGLSETVLLLMSAEISFKTFRNGFKLPGSADVHEWNTIAQTFEANIGPIMKEIHPGVVKYSKKGRQLTLYQATGSLRKKYFKRFVNQIAIKFCKNYETRMAALFSKTAIGSVLATANELELLTTGAILKCNTFTATTIKVIPYYLTIRALVISDVLNEKFLESVKSDIAAMVLLNPGAIGDLRDFNDEMTKLIDSHITTRNKIRAGTHSENGFVKIALGLMPMETAIKEANVSTFAKWLELKKSGSGTVTVNQPVQQTQTVETITEIPQ